MTLTTTTQKLIYTGNGSLTEFAYTWKINTNTDLKVYLRTIATGAESLQTLTTHYSVSGVGSAGGGNVTFVSAPADTLQIVIVRAVPLTQTTDYVSNDSFPAEVHESALDTLMMTVQDQAEILDRSIKLSPTNVMTSTEFTQKAADRASKVLGFDSSGELSVTQELGTFQGNWAASTAYSIRDLIKDNSAGKNNIWICITAHTSSGSLPIDTNTDAAKWSLIVDATSSTASAAAAAVSAQLADDYAVKVSGAVTGSDYSAKAHAVGGTGVTDSTGAAKEWAEEAEDNTVAGAGTYSAKHHATKAAASATAAASSQSTASTAATTATNYATKVDGAVTGTDFSSKAWAVGGTNVTDTASRGAAKEWAIEAEDNTVAGAGTYSALHYSAKASTSATAAASSATSAAASSAASSAAGLDYTYSTTTADADPGTGVIRFNHGTLSSATAAYMDDSDANSVDVSTYLLTWDDSSTTSNRGTIKMVKSGTPSTYALYTITGASTDASGYVKLALTHVASNGTFSNSDTVIIHNTRTGDTGSIAAGAVDLNGEKLTLDANANTSIHANVDDQIDIEIAGADDFRFTANTFSVLSGSTLNIDSGATIANSGTATGFGGGTENAYAGVLQANANFVDQCLLGPAVDGRPWNGLWNKASLFSSLMLATLEDEGSNAEINIWDLTEQASGAISTTPLATVDLSAAATPTSIAACMGYLIVGSEDGIAIIDPHDGSWAERTRGWPRTLSTSTSPALASNDVQGVAATSLQQQPLYDPRTDGPIPTFGVKYVSGTAKANSIIKDDGNVWDIAGDGSSQADYGIAFVGSRLITAYSNEQLRLAPDPSLITADLGVNPPWPWIQDSVGGWSIAHEPDCASSANGLAALGAGEGLGLTFGQDQVLNFSDKNKMSADITRAYNTGYHHYYATGLWLANSKTVDRGPQGNTLTENGTVTEGAVESGAELNGYSGFSSSNNLTRASDADYDVLDTGAAYSSIWFKSSGNSATEYLHSISNSAGTLKFVISLVSDGTMQFRDDGATALVDMTSTATYDDGAWHKADFVRGSSTERYMYIDGVLITSSTADAGSLSSSGNIPIGIGVDADGSSAPATSSTLSLAKFSNTNFPTAVQIRQAYFAERGMFVASAECLLQSSSTDAVIDVDVDPLTSKVLVTQTDAITVFSGLTVDSKPTVNSGSSEKGKLWGALRTEQNSANAYVTAPAVDQRQVNEMVRGLSAGLPKGVDLSKAKAWIMQSSNDTTPVIQASLNIASITRDATGEYTVTFGIPFKADDLGSGGASKVGWAGFFTGHVYMTGGIYIANADSTRAHAKVITRHNDNTSYNTSFSCVFFGELENE